MLFVFIFSLFFVVIFQITSAIQICPHTVELNVDEIYFFESLNFPQPVPINCSINFKLKAFKNNKAVKFVSAITNPYGIQNKYTGEIYGNVFEVTENVTDHLFIPQLNSFQGFALFDDGGYDPCALGSVNNVKPFNFSDDTQILFIRTSYYDEPKSNKSCKWLFTGPEGYGFKIVFNQLSISSSANLTVLNSTQHVITNQNLVKLHLPYYNNDNHLKIIFSKGNLPFSNIMQAYITIVKNDPTFTLAQCYVESFGNFTTYWSTNKSQSVGYLKNSKCSYDLYVFPGTEVIAIFNRDMLIERNVDIIKYTDEYGEKQLSHNTAFRANKNGTMKHYKFELSSDGSIQSTGFQLRFWKIGTYIFKQLNVKKKSFHLRSFAVFNT